MTLPLILGEYYYLRQRLPIFIYLLYVLKRRVNSPFIDTAINSALVSIGLIITYTFTGLMLKIPFQKLIPFTWHYPGLLTWGLFFPIYYYISLRAKLNKLTSFTFATLATVGGGWLYEFSFYHPLGMFIDHNTIFYLNGQILCLLLLAYELKKMGFKPNKPVYATLTLFIMYSAITSYNMSMKWPPNSWFMRIPACLFLLSLLGGIKK